MGARTAKHRFRGGFRKSHRSPAAGPATIATTRREKPPEAPKPLRLVGRAAARRCDGGRRPVSHEVRPTQRVPYGTLAEIALAQLLANDASGSPDACTQLLERPVC